MKSLLTATDLLKKLSAQQQQVFSSDKIEGDYTADEWCTFLRELLHFDEVARRAKVWATLICVIGAALLMFGVVVQNWWIAGAGGATFFLLGLPRLIKLSGKKLHLHARRFALPVIEILRQDLDEKTPILLKVDLGDTCAAAKQTDQRETPKSELPQRVHRRTEYLYTNPWFSLSTKLIDGSKLAFSAVDHVLRRCTVKQSLSGKTKMKNKYKTKQQLTLRLRPPSEDYQWTAGFVLTEQPQALSNGMLAWVKKQPGSIDTLLLRREKRDTSMYQPKGGSLDPERFVETVDTALVIVRPPEAPTSEPSQES
jgi:hypothetical protein